MSRLTDLDLLEVLVVLTKTYIIDDRPRFWWSQPYMLCQLICAEAVVVQLVHTTDGNNRAGSFSFFQQFDRNTFILGQAKADCRSIGLSSNIDGRDAWENRGPRLTLG